MSNDEEFWRRAEEDGRQKTAEEEEAWWTTEAMINHGGSFVALLGQAYRKADVINQRKIRETWPQYWAECSGFGARLRQRSEAEEAAKE